MKSVGSHTLPTDFNGQPLLRYGESEFTQYTVGNFSSRAFKRCIGEIVIRRQRKVIVENRVKNSRAPCVCQIEGFRPWLASSISDGGRPLENKQDNMMNFDPEDPARCPDRPVWTLASFRKIEENRNSEVTVFGHLSTGSLNPDLPNTPLESSAHGLSNGLLDKSGFAEPDFW